VWLKWKCILKKLFCLGGLGGGGREFKLEFKFDEWKSLRNLQPAGSKLHILRLTMNGR
jgi:hypothetical protein